MQTDEDVGKVAAAVPVIICILQQGHLMRLKLVHSGLTSDKRRKKSSIYVEKSTYQLFDMMASRRCFRKLCEGR